MIKRFATILFILFTIALTPAWSAPQQLTQPDISRVMQKMFSFHIENKELTAPLVRRCFKIYIEQFDPEKCYLLDKEAIAYLNLSDSQVQGIIQRLKAGNYQDFIELNQLFQKSIVRAQKLREAAAAQLTQSMADEDFFSAAPPAQYASNEKVIADRQTSRMVRFYQYQKSKAIIETAERREKVFSLFEKKVRRIENSYLFLQPDGSALSKEKRDHYFSLRILKSFAKSLDTHTSFFSPEEAAEMRTSLEKQFEGVGVVLSESIDGVLIAELIKGSPAEQSGKIQVNDLLIEIDGESVALTSFEDVLEKLKKKDRGEIILGFKRIDTDSEEETYFRVSLKKKPIVMNDERIQVGYERYGDGIIGKIALFSFYETSDGISSESDIKEAIRSLREIGPLYGLVLDLRENAGGFLSQAVKVAGLFVSNGVIVISKYAKGELHFLRNIVSRSYYNGPLVVLTSKMSASASEIVAQALQDYGVAVVVGDERTFGKGSIQYQTVTDERAEFFFKVTVGRYYTASGKSTQIDGVIADIVVPTQYAPYNIGERFLEFPLPPDKVDPAFLDPLTDLDEKTRLLFQRKYLPYLQRVVPFWKKMIPQLRKNSAYRLSRDPNFQAFMKRQEKIRARQNSLPANTIDEMIHIGIEDLQMGEAVNIVRDMIILEAEIKSEAQLEKTGS
ncbi:MAG: PDZ domain-containing protein [Verrucomicrobia bacterium]|nr:PDZ domain-containing protein [Verrucomicrobiota bacterium]